MDLKNVKHAVSEKLFGLFLEDINLSVDGGLNANVVSNHSFDGIYLEKGGMITSMQPFLLKKFLNQLSTPGRVEMKKMIILK